MSVDAELRAAERSGDYQRREALLRRAGLWKPAPLPAEVVEHTRGFFAWLLLTMIKFRAPDPERIRYFEKEHYSRADAWLLTCKSTPPLPEGPYGPGARWIWRKAHGDTYWIYVNTGRVYQGLPDELFTMEPPDMEAIEETSSWATT